MITSENELQELCRFALKSERVALDTEFIWERTFYPRLGVVQMGTSNSDVHLIDAIALPTLPGLGQVLADPNTQLILHDAPQDLQILSRHTGASPRNVFDTRRAAGLAGMLSTISLANLLNDALSINLPKSETRSNWLLRPLSNDQIEYALDDIRYLHALSDAIIEKAVALGNGDALIEEMRMYDEDCIYTDVSAEMIYFRFKPFRWPTKQRVMLYTLVLWREEEARRRDKPRGHIMQDADLLCITQHCPRSNEELDAVPCIPNALRQRLRQPILDAAEAAERLHPDALPAMATPERLNASQKQKIQDRQANINKAATEAGIDPALVATKAEITLITLYEDGIGPRPPERLLSGWRAHLTKVATPPPQNAPVQQTLNL